MADASPRTDISTDADTDERNKRVTLLLSVSYRLVINVLETAQWVQKFSDSVHWPFSLPC